MDIQIFAVKNLIGSSPVRLPSYADENQITPSASKCDSPKLLEIP